MGIETFVITCNDYVEHVVIGTEQEADVMLRELATLYYQRTFAHISREAYNRQMHWVARPTALTRGGGIELTHDGKNTVTTRHLDIARERAKEEKTRADRYEGMLIEINETIYGTVGEAMGENNYFKIRGMCAEAERARHKRTGN